MHTSSLDGGNYVLSKLHLCTFAPLPWGLMLHEGHGPAHAVKPKQNRHSPLHMCYGSWWNRSFAATKHIDVVPARSVPGLLRLAAPTVTNSVDIRDSPSVSGTLLRDVNGLLMMISLGLYNLLGISVGESISIDANAGE